VGSKKKAKKDKAVRVVKARGLLTLKAGRTYRRRDGALARLTEAYLKASGDFLDGDSGEYYWKAHKGFVAGSQGHNTADLVEELPAVEPMWGELSNEPCPPALLVTCADGPTKEVVSAVLKELEGARKAFPPMASLHEAFSILLEEVDELKAEVQKKQLVKQADGSRKANLQRTTEAKREAIQVGAMAMRLIIDCCLKEGASYGK
jgi:hypothetical protein